MAAVACTRHRRRLSGRTVEQGRIGDAAGEGDDGVAAKRMADGTNPRGVDPAAESLVVKHGIDDGADVDSAQPPQRRALDRVILECSVAGMVDCDDDEAVRGERRAEPRKLGRHAAVAVGQHNQRTPWPRCRRCIARGVAGAEERDDARPDPLRFLPRVTRGRVPDRDAKRVDLSAAPIVGLGRDKISDGDADPGDSFGMCRTEHREED